MKLLLIFRKYRKRYFLHKNKSGFATYFHMKLLLIFRKYRKRYFLHNKKQRPYPASLPDTASACISRSRFDHAERFRCETALLDFSSLLLILSSRLPVLIRKLRFEPVLLCAHGYRSRILAAEAGMTVFVASYQ